MIEKEKSVLDDRSILGSVLFANRESSSMPGASSSMPFDCRFALIGYVRDRIRQRYYQRPRSGREEDPQRTGLEWTDRSLRKRILL